MTTIDPFSGREVPDPAQAARDVGRAPDRQPGNRVLDLDDALLFAPRAVEGLARSTVGLVDLLPGVNTGIADRRSELLGRSDTFVGSLLEGVTQVMVPYGAFSKGLRTVSFLAEGGTLSRAAAAATKSARFGRIAGRIGREAIAGSAADFVAFSGTADRLSNVLQQAGIGGAVTDFLAADKDDPELEGRLKNAIEGAALGIATDAAMALLSAVRAGRKVRMAGGTVEQATGAFRKEAERAELREKAERFLRETQRGGRAISRQIDEARKANPDAAAAMKEGAVELEDGREATPGARTNNDRAAERVANGLDAEKGRFARALAGQVDPAGLILTHLKARVGLTDERIKHAVSRFNALVDRNADNLAGRLGGDPRKLTEEQRAVIGLSEGGMNLSAVVENDAEVLALIRGVEKELGGKGFNLRTPPQTEIEMAMSGYAAAADIMQVPDEDLQPLIASFVTDTRRVGTLSVALQVVMGSSANRALGILKHLSGKRLNDDAIADLGIAGLQPDEALEEMSKEIRRLAIFRDGRALGSSNLGRALRGLGVPTDSGLLKGLGELPDVQTAQGLRQFIGDKEYAKRLEMIAAVGDMPSLQRTSALARLSDMTTGRKILAVSTEWFINSLLSSPKTITTNFLFPTATAVYVPLEQMVGGALRFGVTGGREGGDLVSRAARTLVGMTMAMGEASTAGLRAFKDGPQLMSGGARRDDLGAHTALIGSESFGALFGAKWGPEGPFAAAIDAIGKVSRMPTRLMNSSDEFVKTFAARGMAYARLTQEAVSQGMDPATFVPDALDKMFQSGVAVTDDLIVRRAREIAKRTGDPIADGLAMREAINEVRESLDFDTLNPITVESLKFGSEVTATSDLPEGSFGHRYQQFVNGVPAMRLITPFVRTPVNLVKFAGQRLDSPISVPSILFRRLTGLGLENAEQARLRNVRDILSNDPTRAAEAYGRMTAGLGIYAAGLTLANSGMLTGAGPEDPERRRILLDAGWLPYSVKIGDKYVQYLRADPFAIGLGLIADLTEVARFQYGEDNDTIDSLAVAVMTSVANNTINRTYMAGLRTLFDAVSRGERFAESAAAGLATGFLVPRLAQAVAGVDDPVVKDASGILERIRARTPFLSKDVAPLRNMLGEPIDRVLSMGADPGSPASLWFDMIVPIASREVADDQVRTELASLNYGFAPPTRSRHGVSLNDFKSSSGQTAYDRWQELQGKVRLSGRTLGQELKRLFKSNGYQSLPRESTPAVESPRIRLIRQAVSSYRAEAWESVLKEYPDLANRFASVSADRARARAGFAPLNPLPEAPEPFRSFVK